MSAKFVPRVPDGWSSEWAGARYLVIWNRDREACVTVDFHMRCLRAGWTGPRIMSVPTFWGNGWKQKLCDFAVRIVPLREGRRVHAQQSCDDIKIINCDDCAKISGGFCDKHRHYLALMAKE